MRRILTGAFLAGLLVASLGQLAPPLAVMTQEFTWGFVAIGFLGVVILARHLGQRDPDGAVGDALVAAFIGGMGAWMGQLAFNAGIHDCRTTDATAFFWVTWMPVGALASTLGVVLRSVSRRGFAAILAGLIASDVACGLVQLALGIRQVDLFLGDLGVIIENIDVPLVHVYQRVWVLGLAVAIGLWDAARRRNAWRAAARAWVAVFVVATVLLGSHIGVGFGRGARLAELDAVRDTEHFRFRYASQGEASLFIDAIARKAEWEWFRLNRTWGLHPDGAVEVGLFENYARMREITGVSNPHAFWRRIDLPFYAALGSTFRHELVHTAHPSWRPELVGLQGHVEGFARAWEKHTWAIPEASVVEAGAARAGMLPSANMFMPFGGFLRVDVGNAYDASGAFVGWLIHQFGIQKFIELEQSLDFRSTYGKDLAALDGQWRQFLASIHVDLEERNDARGTYDDDLRPGYADLQCPKLGPRVEAPFEEAERRNRAGDYAGAARLYQTLFRKDSESRWGVAAARALAEQERFGEALSALKEAERAATELDERDAVLKERVRTNMAARDWTALDEALHERLEIHEKPSLDLQYKAQALTNPDTREAVAKALLLGGVDESRLLEDLYARFPEEPSVEYLMATRGAWFSVSRWQVGFSAAERRQAHDYIALVGRVRGACEEQGDTQLEIAEKAIDTEDYELAEEATGAVQKSCEDPLFRYEADLLGERIAWQRSDEAVAAVEP